MSEDYENYIFRIYRENKIYWYKIRDFSIRNGFIENQRSEKSQNEHFWEKYSNWLVKWYQNIEIYISIEI